jgi:hypothetical protein
MPKFIYNLGFVAGGHGEECICKVAAMMSDIER